MQKNLIALAVAGVFAAPAAFAATSNVDIYGQITASVDAIMPDNAPSQGDLTRVSSNSSRFGFKGSEDLGGGMSAIWQIETQYNTDGAGTASGVGVAVVTGDGSVGLRNTFVGLSSKSLGTVLLGKHDTPYKLATGKLDIFADTAGDYNNIVGNANGGNAFDLRAGNVAAYISPTFTGFHFAAAYVAGGETNSATTDTGADFDAYSMMGMYENGPLFASLAYESHNNYNAGAPSPAALVSRDAMKAGLGFTFGSFKIGGIYEVMSDDAALSTTEHDNWYVNGQFTLGNLALKAAYGFATDGNNAADTEATTYVLGADYNFSKRTKVYAVYQLTDNAAGATYGLGAGQGSAYTPVAGTDPSVISVGMRHVF
jgi:predicted porin